MSKGVKGDGSFWQPLAILLGKQGRTLIFIKVRPRFSIVKFSTLIYNFNNKRKIWINKQGGKIIWQETMKLIKF